MWRFPCNENRSTKLATLPRASTIVPVHQSTHFGIREPAPSSTSNIEPSVAQMTHGNQKRLPARLHRHQCWAHRAVPQPTWKTLGGSRYGKYHALYQDERVSFLRRWVRSSFDGGSVPTHAWVGFRVTAGIWVWVLMTGIRSTINKRESFWL